MRGGLSTLPPWNYEIVENAEEVEKISVEKANTKQHTMVWAWIDQSRGIIRAHIFANDRGIPEDEANGSGAMRLAFDLNKSIEIRHGQGSIIFARPSVNNRAEVGELVKLG